jgi:glycine cleavage system H protein
MHLGANLSGFKQKRTLVSVRFYFSRANSYSWNGFQIYKEFVMNIPTDLKYTRNDEWIKVEGNIGTVGITDYAQDQLSDIVFVEVVVSEGDTVQKGDSCATLESVKAAADVYMPVSGAVVAINEALPSTPETVNSDAFGAAWMVKIELSDPTELETLMDATAYEEHLKSKEA